MAKPITYQLRRFRLRSVLGVLGPLFVVGFYSIICFSILQHPAKNDVAPSSNMNARWVYYIWFILAVLLLDWARTGLANFEAAALMHPSTAPRDARQLMWHAEAHWSNLLWWLRAIRNGVLGYFTGQDAHQLLGKDSISKPGRLWVFLSVPSILLFVSIPLSGLTMELSDAYVQSSEKAQILGPRPKTFNFRGDVNIPQLIRNSWRSGRPTTPSSKALLYAPALSPNVSATYYEDQINSPQVDKTIQVFAGPAVDESVYGNAWGLQANISCQIVSKESLTLISVTGFDKYGSLNFSSEPGKPTFEPSNNITFSNMPALIYETGFYRTHTLYSLVVAADGNNYGSTAYSRSNNFDQSTLYAKDHQRNETSIALFEVFLWQGYQSEPDETLNRLFKNPPAVAIVESIDTHSGELDSVKQVVGFGIQCKVQSGVGNATVDPAYRTYSDFVQGTVAVSNGGDDDVYGIQMSALQSFGVFNQAKYDLIARNPTAGDSSWLALHQALGSLPYPGPNGGAAMSDMIYRALTPEQLQKAILKLLGYAVIISMDQGGQEAWEGELYRLAPVRYLKAGIIPWQAVLVLLTVWMVIAVSTSLGTLFTRRWAPTLSGFEWFKFGAQHADAINGFESTDFPECLILEHVPGMVGMVPGGTEGSKYGFIGLSENQATPRTEYTFDRTQAAKTRV